jgi:hypothetical protein
MKLLGITKIETYTSDHPRYAEVTKEIREMAQKAKATSAKNGSRTHTEGDPILQSPEEVENGYYNVVYSGSRSVQVLQTHVNGYFAMFSINSPNDRQYKIWIGPHVVGGQPEVGKPMLGAEVFDPWNGTLVGSTERSPYSFWSWWACVKENWDTICGSSVLNAVICEAAAFTCTECMLMMIAAFMIACLW